MTSLKDMKQQVGNHNRGTQRGGKELVWSLQTLGLGRSLVVDAEDNIIAGNQTAHAALELGLEDAIVVETTGNKVVIVKRTDMKPGDPRIKQLAYADNMVSMHNFSLDEQQFVFDLNVGVDLTSLFTESEMLRSIQNISKTLALLEEPPEDSAEDDEDEEEDDDLPPTLDEQPLFDQTKAEKLRVKWDVNYGDLWSLGGCKLLCGDCTNREDTARLFGDTTAELCFTSPPYLDIRTYEGAPIDLDSLLNFVPMVTQYCTMSVVNLGFKFTNAEVIRYWDKYVQRFEQHGNKLLAWNVWDKKKAGNVSASTAMFMLVHEWIFVFGKDKKRLNRTVPNNMEAYTRRHGENITDEGFTSINRNADGVVEQSHSPAYTHHQLHSVSSVYPNLGGKSRHLHPATMPLKLPLQYIEAITDEGQIVYDPFCGSGTTLIAAQKLNRIGYGMEISPNYVGIALEMFHEETGIIPERVAA